MDAPRQHRRLEHFRPFRRVCRRELDDQRRADRRARSRRVVGDPRCLDAKRARLAAVQTVLSALDYKGKDKAAIGKVDDRICGGPGLRPKD